MGREHNNALDKTRTRRSSADRDSYKKNKHENSHSRQYNIYSSDKRKRHYSSDEHHDKEESGYNYKKRREDDGNQSTETRTDPTNEDENFTFSDYKYELNRVLRWNEKEMLLQDIPDFWLFVNKYEELLKRTGQSVLKPKVESTEILLNEAGIPAEYSKQHCNNIKLGSTCDELYGRFPYEPSRKHERLKQWQFQQFFDVVLLYLDFKQKEKFTKLKKLRDSQASLPVAQYRDNIVSAVRNERVVIIAGDTGCGKSTQVPQYLHDAGFNSIACTQPRRIACISLSKRVAHEMLSEYGTKVGYQIRFERSKNQKTKICFITEGLLLRQVSSESSLSQYDVLVLDEVHERHLHGDFLLGVAKCLLHGRPDLKLVLMSATINIQLFSEYFSQENAVVIQVPGRLYPIQLHYRPQLRDSRVKQSKAERLNVEPYVQIMQLIDQKYPKTEKGDLLIFLSGMSEITAVVEAATQYTQKKEGWIILPLHSTLSIAEQDKVFDYPPDGVRKCIISTNIAETSVTIDGIRFVVDSGKVKEMSYDPTCKMQRLKEFWISRASAEQRKGRAGRTGPGVCYRLYSEQEYSDMDQYSTPELQRVPLDSLLLQMVSMGLPDARKFPFIEPPPPESIENAILSLKQHGALTNEEHLTTTGKALSRLPVDISLGKMLLSGSVYHQVEPVLTLAAALSVQNPFTNRAYRDHECETARKKLESDHGDPITLLNAYKEWLEIKHNSHHDRQSSGGTRSWCKRRGLEEQRFYEITKLRSQFKDLLQDCGLLESMEQESLSGAERAIRHGELKQLRDMKRTYKNEVPRKRKLLRSDPWGLGEEETETGIDIKDIEFRMSNDNSKVQSLVSGATACSYKDLTMLKLILCSGLYPQVAIADEFNYCKSPNEQLFHTNSKPYTTLHPMSFFGNNPQILQLEEQEILQPTGLYKSKLPLTSKHQLLCYLSLLETTKPYLVNTMRMPAAQTLLLFAHAIDTNATFSRLVCDSWLQLDFPVIETGQILLLKATHIRSQWEKLLTQRLEWYGIDPWSPNILCLEYYPHPPTEIFTVNPQSPCIGATVTKIELNETKVQKSRDSAKLEYDLTQSLLSYMNTEVAYTIKRLLPADTKIMYVGPTYLSAEEINIDPNPFDSTFVCEPHDTKGGIKLTPNIVYGCLIETDWSLGLLNEATSTDWSCNDCSLTACLTGLEKLQHNVICPGKQQIDPHDAKHQETISDPSVASGSGKGDKKYECSGCNKTLYMTTVEILRHKKYCNAT